MADFEHHGRRGRYTTTQEFSLDPILQKRNMRKGYIVKDPNDVIIGTINFDPATKLMAGYDADYGIVTRRRADRAHDTYTVRSCLSSLVYFSERDQASKERLLLNRRRMEFSL